MIATHDDLPDDADALKAMLLAVGAENARLQASESVNGGLNLTHLLADRRFESDPPGFAV